MTGVLETRGDRFNVRGRICERDLRVRYLRTECLIHGTLCQWEVVKSDAISMFKNHSDRHFIRQGIERYVPNMGNRDL